jgi:hypothetical protein
MFILCHRARNIYLYRYSLVPVKMERKVNESFSELSPEDKKEFEELQKILASDEQISRQEKRRLAKFSLKLINQTPLDEIEIMKTSYILASFIFYKFNDKLDDAFDIASELEMPEEQVKGDVFELWYEMKKKFEKYLNN